MPQVFNKSDELSLRHLPDVSNTSFSFQIPGTAKEENLLAQDDLDFFGGVEMSPPLNSGPSTARELTPRPALEEQPPQFSKKPFSFPKLSYDNIHDTIPKQENPTSIPEPSELSKLFPKGISKPSLTIITQSNPHLASAEGSSTSAQIEAIKTQMDVLEEGSGAVLMDNQRPKGIRRASLVKKQPHSRPERRGLRQRQKIVEGGITKTRSNVTLASRANDAVSPREKNPVFPSLRQPTFVEDLNGDLLTANLSMTSMTSRGAAERLVQYGQKHINSFGVIDQPTSFMSEFTSQNLSTGTVHTAIAPVDSTADAATDVPLTLSQLSPRKKGEENDPPHARTSISLANAPMSPLRPPSKRPMSVVSDIHHGKRSRGDNDAPVSAIATAPNNSGSSRSTQKYLQRHQLSGSSSNARLGGEKISRGNASKERGNASTAHTRVGTRQPPAFNPGSRKLKDDGQGATKSRNLGSSSGVSTSSKIRVARPQWDDTTEPANSISSTQGKKDNKGSSCVNASRSAPLNATKPAGFQWHTEARLDARRRDGELGKESAEWKSHLQSSQRDKKYLSSIPDFKALHAAHNSELVLRKENIRPTIPLPIRWETDERVKERQKFDEMIKQKQHEQERLMEVRRKEQVEQEERDIRELRKKAVPKAHEVPEWYKEAPKRKDKAAS